ncbi:MAG TPA: Gfo/Idh/MocA family oxidoreductase [Fibrobacteraceae bacterium]|nr:Gfo/Idh/MocA family oxidoreductase [Fibrobacteraceae bacterium]
MLLGCGGIGRHHLRLLRQSPEVEFCALVDPAKDSMDGIRVFADWNLCATAIANGELPAPQAAIVATPISTHFALVKNLLDAGLHVFVEKPLAPEIAEAQALVDLAQKQQRVLMVGHSERQNPAFQVFFREFQAGITGQVYRIECNRTGPFPQRLGDAGATIDLAVHDLECLSHILGNASPQWMFARIEQRIHPTREDGLNAMLGYAPDILVQMTVNWLSPRKARYLNVYGHAGMLQCDFYQQRVTFFQNLYQRSRPDEYGIGGIEVGPEKSFDVPSWEPLAREHELFFEQVRKGQSDVEALRSACLAVEIANQLTSQSQENFHG